MIHHGREECSTLVLESAEHAAEKLPPFFIGSFMCLVESESRT